MYNMYEPAHEILVLIKYAQSRSLMFGLRLHLYPHFVHASSIGLPEPSLLADTTLVNVYVDLVVFTRIAGTS